MKKLMITAVAAAMMAAITPAMADAASYDVTVKRGRSAESENTIQFGKYWSLHSKSVGGDYTLQTWIEAIGGANISNKYRIDDGTRLNNKKYTSDGGMVHVNFNSDWNNLINIRATGTWDP